MNSQRERLAKKYLFVSVLAFKNQKLLLTERKVLRTSVQAIVPWQQVLLVEMAACEGALRQSARQQCRNL